LKYGGRQPKATQISEALAEGLKDCRGGTTLGGPKKTRGGGGDRWSEPVTKKNFVPGPKKQNYDRESNLKEGTKPERETKAKGTGRKRRVAAEG